MSGKHVATAAAVAAVLVAPTAQAEPEEFAGFYAGMHAGYMDARADFDSGGNLTEGGSFGGFQIGANIATGNLIWGVETDVSLSSADPAGACPFLASATCSVDVQALSTVRARVGFVVMDDLLIYVTGGGAAGRFDVDSTSTTSAGTVTTHDDEGELGWTAGAGIEYLVGSSPLPGEKHVGIKIEYRYLNLSKFDIDNVPGLGEQNIDFDSHAVMAGVNWHF